MNKAIFLDRDGVINRSDDTYYIHRPEDFTINEGVVEALLELQEKGYLLIIITNQGGISRGIYTRRDVERLHRIMLDAFEPCGIRIKEIYYCPHHPGEEACLCHKPEPLMLEKALARFQVNPEDAYFIGDSERDVEAALKAGIHPVKIDCNQDLRSLLDRF
jgi:D-glycero-D-manno-heptose 1,7-bisphosphate phosphatase